MIYWSEWGKNPRIARASIMKPAGIVPEVTTVLDSSEIELVQPNGLALDVKARELYIGDANPENPRIIKCDITGKVHFVLQT